MTSTKKPSNDSREKRLRELGETLKALSPQEREQAVKIAGKALALKARNKAARG